MRWLVLPVILLLAGSGVDAAGLVDNPIIGHRITYLDGVSWIASISGSKKHCTFKSNTDFSSGPGGGDGQKDFWHRYQRNVL